MAHGGRKEPAHKVVLATPGGPAVDAGQLVFLRPPDQGAGIEGRQGHITPEKVGFVVAEEDDFAGARGPPPCPSTRTSTEPSST